MKLDLSNNKKNENKRSATQGDACQSKNVQPAAQVKNNANVMHEVDVTGLMTALKTNGRAKLSEHFKDAEVVEPIEETKDAIKQEQSGARTNSAEREHPRPQGKPEAKPAPKVTIKKKVTLKKKAAPKATYSVEEYTTKKGKTAYLLFGFDSKEAAEKIAEKCVHTVTASWRTGEDGEKRYCLSMGSRYGDFARVLCAGLNQGDKKIINGACAGSYNVYEQAVAEGKARSEERKAERAAAKAEKKPAAKTYSESEVATLLKSVIAGEAKAMDEVKKLMKKAA